AAMKKSDRRAGREQRVQQQQFRLPLRELVREALFDTVVVAGLEYVGAVLEEERTELCGLRYQHDPERLALRAGSVTSSLTLGGRRVGVQRPRVRSLGGHELTLPSWRTLECARPAQSAGNGTDGAGGFHASLCALTRAAAGPSQSRRSRQERGEQAVR